MDERNSLQEANFPDMKVSRFSSVLDDYSLVKPIFPTRNFEERLHHEITNI